MPLGGTRDDAIAIAALVHRRLEPLPGPVAKPDIGHHNTADANQWTHTPRHETVSDPQTNSQFRALAGIHPGGAILD